jgi:hypothetical protein
VKRIALLAILLMFGPTLVFSQDSAKNTVARNTGSIPAAGVTIDDLVSWLKNSGHEAEVVTASNGVRHVTTLTGTVDVGIYLFDCKEGHCGSIQFAAGFATHGKFDVSRMNEWNTKQRWARGYYDSTNDPWIEMDVDLTPGGTYELLDDEFATWNSALANFMALYGL